MNMKFNDKKHKNYSKLKICLKALCYKELEVIEVRQHNIEVMLHRIECQGGDECARMVG